MWHNTQKYLETLTLLNVYQKHCKNMYFFFICLMKRTKMFTIASKFVFGSIIMSYEIIK